ncbi:hypothetical protein GCM10010446_24040 [Streptomyces enissocaesilis]|uniref:Uncharacterized protein n=1 Tax=Streptomyces enissocaesilis TaxID=332589 RepID=A0ABN3X746_9ACTN
MMEVSHGADAVIARGRGGKIVSGRRSEQGVACLFELLVCESLRERRLCRRRQRRAGGEAGRVRFRGARAQRRRVVSRCMCDSFSGLRTA